MQRNGLATSCEGGRVTLFIGLCFVACVVGTIFFGLDGREDVICNGVSSISPKQQRVCTPPKTQDVKAMWSASYLNVYRYALDKLPESNVTSSRTRKSFEIKYGNYRYSAFVLSVGGVLNFTFSSKRDTSVDVYLMTLEQYNIFERKGNFKCEWSKTNTMHESTQYIAREATTYYIVFDASYEDASVSEDVNTTTRLYNVSKSTANGMCAKSCTFKRVQTNEVIIGDYKGSLSSVGLVMNSGKGALNQDRVFPLLSFCFISACLGIGLALTLCKRSRATKTQRQPKEYPDDRTSSIPSGSWTQAPLIQHEETTPEGDIDSYGTAPMVPGTENNNGCEYDGMNSIRNVSDDLENV